MPGLGKITSAGLIAAMPELGQVSEIAAAPLGVAPDDHDSGRRQGQRQSRAGAARSATSSTWRVSAPRPSTTPCSRPSMPPGCQRKGEEGCAHRLHAQAHRHPQHHDRAASEMGCDPLQSERPRSASAERMPSLKTGGRTGSRPSAAGGGAAAASLEPGRTQVYENTVAPR